ncbi:MAG: hypothetical protein ABI870_15555 [Rhodanobacter sp.]
MKYENLMLQTLFAVCALVCLLVLGSMLTAKPATYVASSHAPVAATANTAG